eukprot:10258373-Heterocapsa_arctica.AAC.1
MFERLLGVAAGAAAKASRVIPPERGGGPGDAGVGRTAAAMASWNWVGMIAASAWPSARSSLSWTAFIAFSCNLRTASGFQSGGM